MDESGITIKFWQLLVLMGASGALPVVGMVLGAWFVFKTKHAQLNIPFMQNPLSRTADAGPQSYVDGMFNMNDELGLEDEAMSDAAKRVASQRHPTSGENLAGITGGI